MTFAALPVKSLARAKQRLAGLLTVAERTELAWLLYRNSLRVLLAVEALEKVVVGSSDPRVLDHARGVGAEILEESTQTSHSQSADLVSRRCAAMGAARVLLVPIDVPLLSVNDIEQVVGGGECHFGPDVVIVPSADGTGTNALLQTPPNAVPCRFGPGSFEAHRREAAQRGIAIRIVSPPGLTFDLDEPEDVISLMRQRDEGDVSRYLAEISAAERADEYLARKLAGEQPPI